MRNLNVGRLIGIKRDGMLAPSGYEFVI